MSDTTRAVITGLRASRERWVLMHGEAAGRADRARFLRSIGRVGRAMVRRQYVKASNAGQ